MSGASEARMIPFVHDSAEWHALRARHVGASEVAALFGMQPAYALSRYALWHVKAGNAPAPEVSNPRAAWGLRLEEAIAAGVAETRGWTVEKGGYVEDATTPGLGCSLDYTATSSDRPGPGALELKNSDWLVHRRTWVDDEPPEHVLLQLQAQLACTGWLWGAVGCLVGGNDLRVYEYVARPRLIAEIRSRVSEFWRSVVEGQEPRVDGSDSAATIIRALHPSLRDDEADLTQDNELPQACAQLLEAAARRKQAEAEEAEAKNRIAAKLGDRKRARAAGFYINVVTTAERPDRPAIANEIIKGRRESRSYRVKESAA